MPKEQNRQEFKGIDPKSYGDFDKFMDRAQKITKYIFPVLGASLTAGCTVEIINTITKTAETPELSPLSPDLTKTPTLSPTDVNYELTPTVQNPATQELTLVSETEVATEIPTITLTPEPTATATEMPTPTEISEKYPIDLEKLRNFPQSYEYLVAHPEEFVEAPNPLEDIDAFNQWWNEKFIPIMGDRSEREKNMIMGGGGVLGDNYDIKGPIGKEKPLQGEPEMLFFENKGIIYPIAIINVGYESDPHANYTMAIILIHENILEEKGSLMALTNGKNIKMLRIYLTKNPDYPGIKDNLIDVGIKGDFSEENKLIFGPGSITTTP